MAHNGVRQRKARDVERMKAYITAKVVNQEELESKKVGKGELAQAAGFALTTVEKNVLEKSNIYTDLSHDYINRTGFALDKVLDELTESINNGEIKDLDIMQKVRLASTLTTIYKGLLPTYKKKETKRDIDGTITSVWTTINQ